VTAGAKECLHEDRASAHSSPACSTWCHFFGMRPGAPETWAVIHVKPHVVMAWYFSADALSLFTLIFNFLIPITRRYSIAGAVATSCQLLNFSLFWHWGVACAKCTFRKAIMVPWALGIIAACIVGFTRANEDLVPQYKSRLIFTAVSAVGIFCTNIAMKCGGSESSFPEQLYTSMLRVLFESLRDMIKILDSLTDMAMVTILLAEVCRLGYIALESLVWLRLPLLAVSDKVSSDCTLLCILAHDNI
jgi:hypothetical protein